MKKDLIIDYLKNKKIVIVGFGREGISSYRFIRHYFPTLPLTIADQNSLIHLDDFQQDEYLTIIGGEHYDQQLNQYDLILKSPGVNLNRINYFIPREKFTSQTELFHMAYRENIIGVTGTKGKSTTSSLIYHILQNSIGNTILAGNIGTPFFDIIDQIQNNTNIVAELSAHQLEFTKYSPHVAILLNLYQEHLDHFNTFNNYQLAKFNITAHQNEDDIFIYNFDDQYIPSLIESYKINRRFIPFSSQITLKDGAFCTKNDLILSKNNQQYGIISIGERPNIPGLHNNNNIMAAVLACKTRNISNEDICTHLATFKGLEHRLELVGTYHDITFYNDSISTIPETAIAALKTIKRVDTIILGGFDRGIDYQLLINYLHNHPVRNIAFTGPVGERLVKEWERAGYELPEHYILENDFTIIVKFAYKYTQKGYSCILSPAASSYDQFKDFTIRGKTFKELVTKIGNQ